MLSIFTSASPDLCYASPIEALYALSFYIALHYDVTLLYSVIKALGIHFEIQYDSMVTEFLQTWVQDNLKL